ncbi:hypothetical protein JQ615_30640 [Bradyrhizobium jicamae]|uniref:Limiting CO2-inducible protein B/C beta carbonyic anhydrase domain-containing protein n=1 Tax=Bradyrhizobium jicamae TaxID=280332 RepID=A0ABS5FSL1_9BRAD|nr:hypothetical protein [Bradyrhizobium jicamae]MBR0799738.1 hypothetical protein [Bradyrhizobium jicamae]MBR0933966.1 hypothetical protein [Bradyrhizobium jicamae]
MIETFRVGPFAMRYSQFVPRLYNYCRSLGFERRRMMPSRAFCSDESQGYPVMLLVQHFGTFPFDHGRVGGKVAINRHGPYAHHGEDLVIIQASHVGYDADAVRFGVYQRHRTDGCGFGDCCGKLCAVLHWYQDEYAHACRQVQCGRIGDEAAVRIDNQYLDESRSEGVFLRLDSLVESSRQPLHVLSTSKLFRASPLLRERLGEAGFGETFAPLGSALSPDLFEFRRVPAEGPEGHDILEAALAPVMPVLVTSANPALDAARFVTQAEFDRTYRSILREPAFRTKNVLFVSGVNIDVSPREEFPFPLTKFVPWAAYARLRDGCSFLLEQEELAETLRRMPGENPDCLSFDATIERMTTAPEIRIPVG